MFITKLIYVSAFPF